MIETVLGLGSNLDDPAQQLRRAIAALHLLPDSEYLTHSSFYLSPPMGPQNQPDYVNAVAMLQTQLGPFELLEMCQKIEGQQRRCREGERWGPRTIDVDILCYGDQVINTDSLTVPHPGIADRAFVLLPFAEIAPDWRLPDGRIIGDMAAQLSNPKIQRLS